MNNFLGRDGFVWWVGIVEDIDDPLTLGRCKVRIFGYHGEKTDIPTENLPWAVSIHPVNLPNFYGTPRVGDWIFGFFLDSIEAQEPAMLGYFPYRKADDERNFKQVTQKDSIVFDINDAIISVSNTGDITLESNSANVIFETDNAKVSIFKNGDIIFKSNGNITIETTKNFKVIANRVDIN